MKGNTKRTSGNSLSQTLLTELKLRPRCRLSRRVEIFENIVLLYCTDEFENDYVTVSGTTKKSACAHQKSYLFKSPALRFRVDRQEVIKTQRVDVDYFANGEEVSFFKPKRMRVDGA